MKKVLLAALMLAFSLSIPAFAANGQSQGSDKSDAAKKSVPATANGNAVKTEEKNKVMNQGEDTQIQTQEKNTAQVKDGEKKDKINEKKTDTEQSEQRKSQVAIAVQAMLQIADRDIGIGQQVRIIAQNQNQNQIKLEKNVEKIQSRGGFAKFFIGPNYGEIKDAEKTLEQNKEQIRQMNQIRTQLSNEGDQQQLAEQIKVLEQYNQEIESLLSAAQDGFSLFGWLNNIVS